MTSRSAEHRSWHEASLDELFAAWQEASRLAAQIHPMDDQPFTATLHHNGVGNMGQPQGPLGLLQQLFGLSDAAVAIVALCCGTELHAVTKPGTGRCTVAEALRCHGHAAWPDLAPDAPLRRWGLVELGDTSAHADTPLRISESVLHFLIGHPCLDPRLVPLVESVEPPAALGHAQQLAVHQAARSWADAGDDLPVLQVVSGTAAERRRFAAAVCAAGNLGTLRLPAERLPSAPVDAWMLLRLAARDAVLGRHAVLVEVDDADDPRVAGVLPGMLLSVPSPVVCGERAVVVVDVPATEATDRRRWWEEAVHPDQREAVSDELVERFPVGPDDIAVVVRSALAATATIERAHRSAAFASTLWHRTRALARPRLDGLAEYVEPAVSWDDLVLARDTRVLLERLVAHVHHRHRVLVNGSFGTRHRGLATTALFSGASGTGKTMAAEAIAHALGIDLFVVDLSGVVSKWVGETEKHLARIFDAADRSSIVLLFDEADALFGRRSEVRDSHDRYANIEISYLLQRMESFRGVAVLTSNLRSNLDPAFTRRLRFVVDFPFPDERLRAQLWSRAFPPHIQTDGLPPRTLARLELSGGEITAIALEAAVLAREEDTAVTFAHVRRSAHAELAKVGRSLPRDVEELWQ